MHRSQTNVFGRRWIFIFCLLLQPLSAGAAVRPEDGAVFHLEIPASDSSPPLWLGARPVEGLLSFVKNEASAVDWRFHKQTDDVYTIESLVDGKRWLVGSSEGAIRLGSSDSALTSRWQVKSVGENLLLENFLNPNVERFLVITANSVSLGTQSEAEQTPFILRPQTETPPPLAHGDVISIRSMGGSGGRLWLDGNTTNGMIGLASEADMLNGTGTKWRVHDNADGSFSFESLGYIPGRRWLKMDATPFLANTNDRAEAVRWKVVPGPLGTVAFKNVSRKSPTPWLDSYPELGATSLAANLKDSSGTYFQILMRQSFNPRIEGRWSALESMPVSGIHTHVLPNGKVLLWSRFQDPTDVGSTIEGVVPGRAATYIYDPLTASLNPVPNAETDVFCSGHTFLPDGRLHVTGGHIRSNVGFKSTQIYDFVTNTWETHAAWDMAGGRWYPTNIALGNGDILTVSGDATSAQDVNRLPEVWSARDQRWRTLPGLSSSCFNESNGPCMPLYPWLHLLPDGKVFVSGPGQDTGTIDTKGDGAWTAVAKTNFGYRGDYEATATMYAPGKIMIAGGVPSNNSVETIDLNQPDPKWKSIAPMFNKRHKLTSTLLADGQVLVTGGSAADGASDDPAIFATEIWNPETGLWTEGDHLTIPRLYHSTAVLLPDGRVLSMGGGLGAGFNTHKNFEIYSPPYLFKGPRPSLKVKEHFIHGERITIESPESPDISKVHLIKLSSDTHGFNSGQHIVPLAFARTASKTSISVTIPHSSGLAPPGYYLLFVVNKAGVPSLGKTVRLEASTQVDTDGRSEATTN